jgi:hypothetical protein
MKNMGFAMAGTFPDAAIQRGKLRNFMSAAACSCSNPKTEHI